MIELRWLIVRHDEPVLQYRTKLPTGEWSPWKDVRTEWLV